MAVSFDSKSMSEDSIMISSTGNIETNNREIQALNNSYPLNNRSASLGILENTIGVSGMTRRRNSEIDLVRASVSPKTLLFFFKSPIDDNVIKGAKEAEKIANKAKIILNGHLSLFLDVSFLSNFLLGFIISVFSNFLRPVLDIFGLFILLSLFDFKALIISIINLNKFQKYFIISSLLKLLIILLYR